MKVIEDGGYRAGRNDASGGTWNTGSEPNLASLLGHMIMILTTYVLADLVCFKFHHYINLYIKLGSSFINLYKKRFRA